MLPRRGRLRARPARPARPRGGGRPASGALRRARLTSPPSRSSSRGRACACRIACASSGRDQKSGAEAFSFSSSSALRAASRSKIAPERREASRGVVKRGDQVVAFGHGRKLSAISASAVSASDSRRSRRQRTRPTTSTAAAIASQRRRERETETGPGRASSREDGRRGGRCRCSSGARAPRGFGPSRPRRPEMPVMAARRRYRSFSTDRSTAPAKCWAWAPPRAVPGVVRNRDEEVRASPHLLPREDRVKDLVADSGADPPGTALEHGWLGRRGELPDLGRHLSHEEEDPGQGHVLAEGNEVHFPVGSGEPLGRE